MDSDDEVVEEAVEGTTGFSPGSWGGDRRLGRKAPKRVAVCDARGAEPKATAVPKRVAGH